MRSEAARQLAEMLNDDRVKGKTNIPSALVVLGLRDGGSVLEIDVVPSQREYLSASPACQIAGDDQRLPPVLGFDVWNIVRKSCNVTSVVDGGKMLCGDEWQKLLSRPSSGIETLGLCPRIPIHQRLAE